MRHEIKIYPEYFNLVNDGTKPFEIRKNDRDYKLGDRLFLREYCTTKEEYTDRYCLKEITYVLKGGSFGLDPDYVILGLIDDNEIIETLTACSDELMLTSIEGDSFFDFALDQMLKLISSVKLVGKSEVIRQEAVAFISTHKQSKLSNNEKTKILNLMILRMKIVALDLS